MEDKFAEWDMNTVLQRCEKRTIGRPYFSPPVIKRREKGILYLDPNTTAKKPVAIIFYYENPDSTDSRAVIFMTNGIEECWLIGFEDFIVDVAS